MIELRKPMTLCLAAGALLLSGGVASANAPTAPPPSEPPEGLAPPPPSGMDRGAAARGSSTAQRAPVAGRRPISRVGDRRLRRGVPAGGHGRRLDRGRRARTTAAGPDWRTGHALCGSFRTAPQGLAVNAGLLTSYDGRPDYVTYRYQFYGQGIGWLTPSGWAPWSYVGSTGAVVHTGTFNLGTRTPGLWTAVLVEKRWYYAGRTESYWLVPQKNGFFGNNTSGLYCYWSA